MFDSAQARTTRKWRFWMLLAGLLLVIGGLTAFHLSQRSATNEQLDAIRAAGLPTSEFELNDWYTPVPVEENAALVVWEAIQLYAPATIPPIPWSEPRLGQNLPPADAQALGQYLQTNSAALQKVHQAVKLPRSRYPIDLTRGPATLLPHLAKMKALANLLKWEAIHHAAMGRRDEAVQAVEAGFALTRTLRNEPLLISELVRIASMAITLGSLEHVVSQLPLTEPELLRLEQVIQQAEEDGATSYYRALVGERSGAVNLFKLSYAQWQQFSGPGTVLPAGYDLLGLVTYEARRILGLQEKDQRFYLETMADFIGASTNQFPALLITTDEATKRMENKMDSFSGRLALLSRMALPALGKTVWKEASITTQLRCARLGLAVERYRLDHEGELPDSLQELVPAYLASLPASPYTGEPLSFSSDEQGFRIYCQPPAEANVGGQLEFRVRRGPPAPDPEV